MFPEMDPVEKAVLELLPADGRKVTTRVVTYSLSISEDEVLRAFAGLARLGLVNHDFHTCSLTWRGCELRVESSQTLPG